MLAERCGFELLREEWRYMYPPTGRATRFGNGLRKFEELAGLITRPVHDHYYSYLRKTVS
jgi:hypothetical protein